MPHGSRHILLVRHGQSVWNAIGRWQGQADPPLSALGEAQAAEAATRLGDFDFTTVWASDLVRARRTAEIMATAVGLGAVRLDAGLREIDVGDWTGLTRVDIEAGWPGVMGAWSEGRVPSTPRGETRAHLADRAQTALSRVAADGAIGDRILVVSHGALIRTLDRALGEDPLPVANLAGRWYEADGHGRLTPGNRTTLTGLEDSAAPPSP